jgi:predicted transcriptional regulator
VGPPEVLKSALSAELSDEQRRVLECLQKAGTGLTVKQLESRMKDAPSSLEDALARLVERQLVARLNTVIPSYACRQPGNRIHAE